MKKLTKLISLVLAALMLTGCHREEPKPTFDPDTVQTVAVTPSPEASEETGKEKTATWTETFRNANETAEFHVALDAKLPVDQNAVVEAVPRYLTAQDAKAVIDAFFPDVKCYEKHPLYTTPESYWTKGELEEQLERWRSYTYEDLVRFHGGEENLPQQWDAAGNDIPFMEQWEGDLQYFEDLLLRVPEEESRTPCRWEMYKEMEYMVTPDEAKRMDLSQDRDCMMTSIETGGQSYSYVAASGSREGKRSTVISLELSSPSSPGGIDWEINQSELKALPEPTQEQLDKAKAVAQSYLDKFPIGDWVLREPEKSDTDGTIYIKGYPANTALPVEGEVLWGYSDAELSIRVHPDGTLMSFWIGGELVEVKTVTKGAVEPPLEILLENAKKHLESGSTMAFGFPEDFLAVAEEKMGEEIIYQVDITEISRRHERLDTPEGNPCYVPGYCLSGTISYLGKESGRVYSGEDFSGLPDGMYPLLIINAIDGTI